MSEPTAGQISHIIPIICEILGLDKGSTSPKSPNIPLNSQPRIIKNAPTATGYHPMCIANRFLAFIPSIIFGAVNA